MQLHEYIKRLSLVMLILSLLVGGCKKEQAEVVCTAITLNYSSTASNPCAASGTITISTATGNNFSYRLNNGSYQSSPLFTALSPGNYTVTSKSAAGCETTIPARVDEVAAGSLFTEVRTILSNRCLPCHTGINPQAGHDWANSCHILAQWERIKARAVEGNPAPMPPSGLIRQGERDKLLNWMNAGHRYTD